MVQRLMKSFGTDTHTDKHPFIIRIVFSAKDPFIYNSKVFCLKLKILITTELIEFFLLGKLHRGPGMVLGYFSFRLNPCDGFRLFFVPIFDDKVSRD